MMKRSVQLSLIKVALVHAILGVILFSIQIGSVSAQGAGDGKWERSTAAAAIILVGDGEGMVIRIAPAVAVMEDGVLLVPYHVIKDAKELQVRLKSGEIFDDVALLGSDERRDVAAIKIQTSNLPFIASANAEELKAGETVNILTHSPGKLWNLTPGTLIGVKMSDDIPGAGEGFRVVQFNAELSAGLDGAILFRNDGSLAGLVTTEFTAPVNSGFAVLTSYVKGLGNGKSFRSFGSGKALKIPTEAALRAARNPSTDPKDLVLNSKTVFVYSNTTYFKEQQLINELNKRKEIKDWGWVLMTGSWDARNKADLLIELDHQILSFDFTFTVRHRKSSIMISAGKAIIADGASGAPKMADKIIKSISALIDPPPTKGK